LGVSETKGVVVEQVEEGGRAQNAGITTGDVIVEVDRQPIAGVDALQQALKRHPTNTPVLLLVHREGRVLYVTVAGWISGNIASSRLAAATMTWWRCTNRRAAGWRCSCARPWSPSGPSISSGSARPPRLPPPCVRVCAVAALLG